MNLNLDEWWVFKFCYEAQLLWLPWWRLAGRSSVYKREMRGGRSWGLHSTLPHPSRRRFTNATKHLCFENHAKQISKGDKRWSKRSSFFFIQITPPILAPKSEANLPLKCGTVRRNWCVEFHPNDAFSKSGQDAWANMLNWKHMLTDANADVGRSPAWMIWL